MKNTPLVHPALVHPALVHPARPLRRTAALLLCAGCAAARGIGGDAVRGAGAAPARPSSTPRNATHRVVAPPPVRVSLRAGKASYGAGETVRLTVTARNTTAVARTLRFSSGQSFELTATPPGRTTPVWQWSKEMMFTQSLVQVRLAPGAARSWTARWRQTADDGGLVPRGRYVLRAHLATSPPLAAAPVTITLKPAPATATASAPPHEQTAEPAGISGVARLGPISPVERVGQPNSRPLPDAVIILQPEGGGPEAARERTDADGKFRITVAPGTYRLVPLPPQPGNPFAHAKAQTVVVRPGAFTEVVVDYDSGIR